MHRIALLASLVVVLGAPTRADDFKVIKLEQDVRNLEREVSRLRRELDQLRTEGRFSAAPSPEGGAPRPSASTQWLAAARWAQLKPGMSELSVIEVLGPPTSMRRDGERRVLLYALEIGADAFLGGSVTIEDGGVAAIEAPVLK